MFRALVHKLLFSAVGLALGMAAAFAAEQAWTALRRPITMGPITTMSYEPLEWGMPLLVLLGGCGGFLVAVRLRREAEVHRRASARLSILFGALVGLFLAQFGPDLVLNAFGRVSLGLAGDGHLTARDFLFFPDLTLYLSRMAAGLAAAPALGLLLLGLANGRRPPSDTPYDSWKPWARTALIVLLVLIASSVLFHASCVGTREPLRFGL